MQPTNILTFLAVSTFSFTELPSVQFSPCTSSTYWVYRCWTWLFFFPQWKIGFLIRGKCLFSLKIVITFFPLVTKLIWDSFTWMSFFFFFFPFFPKACVGEKCVRASENCSTCMFWIKSWISWKGWDKESSKIWKIKLIFKYVYIWWTFPSLRKGQAGPPALFTSGCSICPTLRDQPWCCLRSVFVSEVGFINLNMLSNETTSPTSSSEKKSWSSYSFLIEKLPYRKMSCVCCWVRSASPWTQRLLSRWLKQDNFCTECLDSI